MKYLLMLLVVLLIPTAALAKGECKEERKKFCPELVKKEAWACLSKHEAELGGPCKAKLEARAKKAAAKAMPGDSAAEQPAPSTAPSTDTQPQPTYPDGEPQ
jgi:hypothetical protein